MKVFLTGATGFVGSALLNRFVADEVKVKALVRNDSVGLPDGVEQIVGDLSSVLVGGRSFDFAQDDSNNSLGMTGVTAQDDSVKQAGDPSALPQDDSANIVQDDSANIVQGDRVKKAGDLSTTLKMTLKDIDVVVHAAARAHIMRDEVADPLAEYRKVNRDATLALARLAAQAGVKRFVFVSSVKVNGEGTYSKEEILRFAQNDTKNAQNDTKNAQDDRKNAQNDKDEVQDDMSKVSVFTPDDKFVPSDPYGVSKYEAEQSLLEIAQETGMEVVIIRPPLVYGPNVKGNFASMVNWVKKGIPLPLGAVRNLRSLVALDNLVDFIALCADPARSPRAANEVFLISDGVDVSTSELLRKVAKACDVKSRLLPVPVGLMKMAAKLLSKGAVADRLFGNLQVDSSKARDLLGWQPVVTMDEALERMFHPKGTSYGANS